LNSVSYLNAHASPEIGEPVSKQTPQKKVSKGSRRFFTHAIFLLFVLPSLKDAVTSISVEYTACQKLFESHICTPVGLCCIFPVGDTVFPIGDNHILLFLIHIRAEYLTIIRKAGLTNRKRHDYINTAVVR
jgi:hypothetical protein